MKSKVSLNSFSSRFFKDSLILFKISSSSKVIFSIIYSLSIYKKHYSIFHILSQTITLIKDTFLTYNYKIERFITMSDEIGTRVKKVRLRKGISQEQFGEIIGIKKAAVSKIENGENSLSKGNLLAICRQFNVNKEWLINGNGEMFTLKSKEDEIRNFFENAISSDSDIAKIQRKFISTLVLLDEEEWIVLDRFMKHYIYSK